MEQLRADWGNQGQSPPPSDKQMEEQSWRQRPKTLDTQLEASQAAEKKKDDRSEELEATVIRQNAEIEALWAAG